MGSIEGHKLCVFAFRVWSQGYTTTVAHREGGIVQFLRRAGSTSQLTDCSKNQSRRRGRKMITDNDIKDEKQDGAIKVEGLRIAGTQTWVSFDQVVEDFQNGDNVFDLAIHFGEPEAEIERIIRHQLSTAHEQIRRLNKI
jgi:hypothetical protein